MASFNSGLNPGSLLRHNTYRIERILGQGGFGITYLATDLALERYVAIKEFFPKDFCERESSTSHITIGTSSNIDLVSRLKTKFLKEARNIAKLDHPGIIKIHTAFEENNTAYYVMDYIEGANLSELIKQTGPLSEEKAVQYIKEVGDALDYIHKHNINHLDIKPANIMIRNKDNHPVLIDFGLSKQYDAEGNQTSTTPTGISHGYAPLEQYKVGGLSEFSPQTDVYSLAATLYYLISGTVPPHATDLIENELKFPSEVPHLIREPIAKAMSMKRQNRYSSVKDFISSINDDEETKLNVIGSKNFKPVEIKLNQDTINNKDKKNINPKEGKKNKNNSIFYIIGGLIVACIAIVTIFPSHDPSKIEPAQEEEMAVVVPDIPTVENMAYKSSLGLCSYTGEVDENNMPHGTGIAKWETGDGKVYDGEWVHGKMEGKTKYVHRSGDTFVGTFENNQYSNGKYTISSTGEYFEGTFKNGQPDKGKWYNKNGKEI